MQAFQTPFLAVQALLQGPGTPAATVISKDVENSGAVGHDDAGELAPGPESGSEAERGSVEGPDGAGSGELGSGENVNSADAEAEAETALNDGAATPSAQAQTVHGADFGGENEEKPAKAAADCNDSPAEKTETDEGGGIPANLQFPKWEIPAFMLLFYGMPNRSRHRTSVRTVLFSAHHFLCFACSCGQVVGAAAYYGGCGSMYAAVASFFPLLAFLGFVCYAIAASVGPSGLMVWQPSSVKLALARMRTVWGGSHLVRQKAVAAVFEAASSQGYWMQRLETELDWSVSVGFATKPRVMGVCSHESTHGLYYDFSEKRVKKSCLEVLHIELTTLPWLCI